MGHSSNLISEKQWMIFSPGYGELKNVWPIRDFPGGPLVKTPGFHCRGHGLTPGWITKVSHAGRNGHINK